MNQPYDPVAYQAELDAKCGRAGSAWLPSKVSQPSRLSRAEKDAKREHVVRMKVLADPEIIPQLAPDEVPDDLA